MRKKLLALPLCLLLLCPLLFVGVSLADEPEFEGENPVYALVLGDEEERSCYYSGLCDWRGYAWSQIEQADEALVKDFSIDIRVLAFLTWDSTDSEHDSLDLLDELKRETEHYLDTWYDGIVWSGYVDIIIGVTNQRMDTAGRAYLGGRVVLVNWYFMDQVVDEQWMDDNLIRHEISHLFGAQDHDQPCCVMATGHEHFVGVVFEDRQTYVVFTNVACCYTTDKWCDGCWSTIWSNRKRFSSSGGNSPLGFTETLNSAPLEHIYGPVIIIILALSVYATYMLVRAWRERKRKSMEQYAS